MQAAQDTEPGPENTKANREEEKEVTSSESTLALNANHKDNSLREFRRLCAGIAERNGTLLFLRISKY